MIIKCREEITKSSDWVADTYIRHFVCCFACIVTLFCKSFERVYYILQERQPISSPAMVREQDPSTWMMFPALALRVDW